VADFTNMTFNRIQYGTAECLPLGFTDNDVTLKSTHCVRYITVSKELYDHLKDLQRDLRRTQKNLRNYPIALAQRRAALQETAASDSRDPSQLDALTAEIARLEVGLAEWQGAAVAIPKRIDDVLASAQKATASFCGAGDFT
jgi:hypothetical protein